MLYSRRIKFPPYGARMPGGFLGGVLVPTLVLYEEKKYAVERVLEIIGEAINKISAQTLAKSNRAIPWRDVVDFRNLITHEYFRVDYTMVYKLATEEIPKVRPAIEFLINELQK